MTALCERLGIKRRTTTVFRPMSNGLCERVQGTVITLLSLLVNAEQDDWPAKLAAARINYRCMVHNHLGMTPYEAVMGRPPRLPQQGATTSLSTAAAELLRMG